VLTGNQQPDHSRISEFRRRNRDAPTSLFVQILRLCQKAGMVSLRHVALVAAGFREAVGTKVERARVKAKAARELAMEKAELAGLDPPDLEPLGSDQMPRPGLAHKADGTPTAKTQRNYRCPACHTQKI
jgi:hypothetical protein